MSVLALLVLAAFPSEATGVVLRAPVHAVVQANDSVEVPFLVVNHGTSAETITLRFRPTNCSVEPDSMVISVEGRGWRHVVARCRLQESADTGTVVADSDFSQVSVSVVRGIDLTTLLWKQTFVVRETPAAVELAQADLDDRSWRDLRVPALWGDNRYAWCRVHVTIPVAWRTRTVRLHMGAVDDNDVTYLNGTEIGRTSGWDIPRIYTLPPELVHWGKDNVLTVMVDNPTYGGGIHKAPVMLLAGDNVPPTSAPASAVPARRPASGRVGSALPLRPMHVSDGVLRYPDGSEVALWGVNIYPQSWYQFENTGRLKVNRKKVLVQDLDHLQQMGVQVIRMHIFDREISDADGNIQDNEHLELLDYLVAQCGRRGIYLYLTPIAWWGGPNENPSSFSAQTSKPGMMFVPHALDAAANYLAQFLTRKNRYTGRAYKDEPSLCVLEIMNEPAYLLYGDLYGSGYQPQGEKPEVLERDHRVFREQWEAWLRAEGLEESATYFPLFRYSLMRRYLRKMVAAIRSTGARQPVACSYFGVNGDDITQAIADSEVEAITVSAYPGGWERVNDGRNLLAEAAPLRVDARLATKARLAYEFDTPATNVSCYLYPALAAHFRAGEVQIACQFQYDSIATARWNTDWSPHWLNWHYTPSKAVSFMIGGEAFRSLPRGVRYDVGDWRAPATSLQLGGLYTSFTANNCTFTSATKVLYARSPGALQGKNWPASPVRIVGTGSSRYVDYGGTGAYILERATDRRWIVQVNPDAHLVGNSLVGSFEHPVGELEYRRHLFRLLLPGWQKARCRALDGSPAPVPAGGGWLLVPGRYEIVR